MVSLQGRIWSKIVHSLGFRHSLPFLIDEVELCLIVQLLFLGSNSTIGYKLSVLSFLSIHLLRGGYRWQLLPTYLSASIFFAAQGHSTIFRVIQLILGSATIGLCYVIPSVPVMDSRGKALGVQDLTLDGPSGKFWVRCFYPTHGSASVPELRKFSMSRTRGIFDSFLSVVAIVASVYAISHSERSNNQPPLLWFSMFVAIHLYRLAHNLLYALPTSAYIPSSEFSSVLGGVAAFATLPRILFSHMSHMRINCIEDAPVFSLKDDKSDGKLKVAFVLHGLGGTRCFYSFICMRLAAEGYFVISPEFSDGTACMTQLPDGTKRPYEPYVLKDGEKLVCEGSHSWRRRQLEHRAQEMKIMVEFFSSLSDQQPLLGKGDKLPTTAPSDRYIAWKLKSSGSASHFLDSLSSNTAKSSVAIDPEATVLLDIKNPLIVGHSFGAATAVHLQRSADDHATAFRGCIDSISGVAALDPWMWPLAPFKDTTAPSADTGHPLDADTAVISVPVLNPLSNPYLVMHTEYFQWPDNMIEETALVRAQDHVLHLRVTDAGHNNFSDTGFLAPVLSGHIMKPKKTGMQDPVYLQETINDLLVDFLSVCRAHTTATAPIANIAIDKKPAPISLHTCLSLAQDVKTFDILEARW